MSSEILYRFVEDGVHGKTIPKRYAVTSIIQNIDLTSRSRSNRCPYLCHGILVSQRPLEETTVPSNDHLFWIQCQPGGRKVVSDFHLNFDQF